MEINEDRLWNRIHDLGKIGADEDGAVTRLPFTEEDLLARDWLIKEMKEAGLNVYQDYVGNIIGEYNPNNSTLPPVLSGSHYDTVIKGGIFDGCLGLLSALEVAQTFKENHVQLKRPLYVMAYKDEEGNRFKEGMIGSKAVAGKIEIENLFATDCQGFTIFDVMKQNGYCPEKCKECRIDSIYASVELHIEQGKVLERENQNIGIVEGIPYIRCYEITVSGISGHAGATPMNERCDPIVAMARWIDEITKIVTKYPKTVVTVGKIQTFPNSSNVICDHVKFTLDIRSLNEEYFDSCFLEINRLDSELFSSGIEVNYELQLNLEGVGCSENLMVQLEDIAERRNLSHMRLMSGAGHDSQSFKNICPIAMIFVKSKDGFSHRKEEFTSKMDCVNGTKMLMDILKTLCNE